ncbi:related to GGA2-Arf-binding protein [Armillaria ostoyae]|uniref:Related to GGA2-Arf-binding protein n=1 Tax=Armillaria ostoyae TaxID=47428 RepID=A0A284RFB6_ARMOS|nr:related to GGA2-Arf-binding protein [Armillaria ostoyae]
MLSSPTTSHWLRTSPLEILITRSCDPSLQEPNYALHIEVANYINNKKANTPREAAMLTARLANNRNPHIAILALALLDTLVQSCGYPFHLQISTKEFLNELVRRFPERPPPFPGPVMSRILELLHSWKEGICVESRWKDDLGNIRDMHRLLTFKGYRFRDLPQQASSLATAANLKTAEELEEEDREAQSAKLQELIRRGTPRDLAAAQELMKSLAGANPDAKPDYKTQALSDLNKLESKVILLNEMLDNVDTTRGERIVSGDVYEQVASILSAARPKIQKWISDAETHDPESLDTFLQINDQINTALDRYEAYKKGDYATAANPIPTELSSARNDLSLIDLDDSAPSSSSAPTVSGPDDLAGLFGSIQPQRQPFAQQFNANLTTTSTYAPSPMGISGAGSFNPLLRPTSMSPPVPSTTPPASIMLPSTPGAGSPSVPSYNRNGSTGMGLGQGLGISHPAPQQMFASQQSSFSPPQQSFSPPQQSFSPPQQSFTPMQGSMQTFQASPYQQQQFQQPSQSHQQPPPQQQQSNQTQGKDPFDDLVGLF